MLNGHSVEYDRIQIEIDNALRGSESAYSTSRIEDFNTYSITDLIQTSLLTQLDEYRLAIKKALDGDDEELRQVATKLALPEQLRKNKKMWKLQKKQIDKIPKERLIQMVFKFTVNICEKLIPELREYSDNAIGTVKMSMQVKYDVKPEILMLKMIQTFLKEHAKEFVLDLEEFDD
jgi:DNA polymerase elongation subunit (family B)